MFIQCNRYALMQTVKYILSTLSTIQITGTKGDMKKAEFPVKISFVNKFCQVSGRGKLRITHSACIQILRIKRLRLFATASIVFLEFPELSVYT